MSVSGIVIEEGKSRNSAALGGEQREDSPEDWKLSKHTHAVAVNNRDLGCKRRTGQFRETALSRVSVGKRERTLIWLTPRWRLRCHLHLDPGCIPYQRERRWDIHRKSLKLMEADQLKTNV